MIFDLRCPSIIRKGTYTRSTIFPTCSYSNWVIINLKYKSLKKEQTHQKQIAINTTKRKEGAKSSANLQNTLQHYNLISCKSLQLTKNSSSDIECAAE